MMPGETSVKGSQQYEAIWVVEVVQPQAIVFASLPGIT